MIRYQSTGKPISNETSEEELAQERELALENNPRTIRDRALSKLREREEKAQTADPFKGAVSRFEYRHPDLQGKAGLLLRVALETGERVNNAGCAGEVVHDWDTELDRIADSVRVKAGMKRAAEAQREESLTDLRASRGLPHNG